MRDRIAVSFFLDANVLFAAAHRSDGRCAGFVKLAREKGSLLLVSPYAQEEARRNLDAKHPEALEGFHRLLRAVRTVKEAPPGSVREVMVQGVPAADAPILAAALQAKADYLVTGDRAHFGHLMDRADVPMRTQVLSVRGALRILLE